ncbi:hypothetical protein [uncultured Methylobacterium sp.]|jgi:hypothetical protein|uniref:hypothetical protein n=1 Tax=uncultured Methylobacterium sp. TaxID=157278 RepID=UPI002638B18D|nr:hypothetical protein [uncultured Methylobacterium sp.]
MLRDYVVLAASGGWVNGQRVTVGATVQLTDAQAEYEVDLGNVRLVGDAAPVVPAILQPGDKLSVLRGAAEHPVTAAEMESYLLGTGRPVRAAIDAAAASGGGGSGGGGSSGPAISPVVAAIIFG